MGRKIRKERVYLEMVEGGRERVLLCEMGDRVGLNKEEGDVGGDDRGGGG